MPTTISRHSKERIVQRTEGVSSFNEAKRVAKQAWTSGKTIDKFCAYPKFSAYLKSKQEQSRTCSVRVYRGNVYIWRGKNRMLVTAHPVPNQFKAELGEKIL